MSQYLERGPVYAARHDSGVCTAQVCLHEIRLHGSGASGRAAAADLMSHEPHLPVALCDQLLELVDMLDQAVEIESCAALPDGFVA